MKARGVGLERRGCGEEGRSGRTLHRLDGSDDETRVLLRLFAAGEAVAAL